MGKCIRQFPPGGRARARAAARRKSAQAKAGSYRGRSISIVRPGQSPTKKRLRRRGRALAAFLQSPKKLRRARPIFIEVRKRGRSATFSTTLSLSCESGDSLTVMLTDLPAASAPLAISRQGYFKLQVEDPAVTARIGGLFLNKRSLVGSLYLGIRIHQRGLCEDWVGFAARRKG